MTEDPNSFTSGPVYRMSDNRPPAPGGPTVNGFRALFMIRAYGSNAHPAGAGLIAEIMFASKHSKDMEVEVYRKRMKAGDPIAFIDVIDLDNGRASERITAKNARNALR